MAVNIISWIIFGSIVGWITALLVNNRDEQHIIPSVLVGIAGALLGGYFVSTNFLTSSVMANFDLTSLMVAILGSILFLAFLRGFKKA